MSVVLVLDVSKFELVTEGKRMVWDSLNYGMLHIYCKQDVPWPHSVRVIANSRNHFKEWIYVVQDSGDFDDYLERALKKKIIKEIEPYLDSHRNETIQKLTRTNYSKASNQELAGLSTYFFDQFERLMLPSGTLRCIDRAIIPRLQKAFSKTDDPDGRIRMVSASDRSSVSTMEEMESLALAIELKKKKIPLSSGEAQKGLKALCEKYCWVSCGYFEEKAKTIEQYQHQVQEMMEGEPEKKLRQIRGRIEQDVERRQKTIEGLNDSERELAKIASDSTFLKDYTRASTCQLIYHAQPLFEEIAKRANQPSEWVKDLLPKEIAGLLMEKPIDADKVNDRIRHSVAIAHSGYFELLVGKEADQFEEKYLNVKVNHQSEFKGRAASPGKAKGTAKIVLSKEEFPKVNAGDVLVVSNTTPDFVPILRKASAIVAEEGGLTAHVSVISREFSIPCVVGIAHITQIVKDGDEIEVDAEKGIVRIVRKATP